MPGSQAQFEPAGFFFVELGLKGFIAPGRFADLFVGGGAGGEEFLDLCFLGIESLEFGLKCVEFALLLI